MGYTIAGLAFAMWRSLRWRAGRASGRRLIARARPTASAPFQSFSGPRASNSCWRAAWTSVCVATPDDRHFEVAKTAICGRQARADRKAVGAVARATRRAGASWPARTECWRKSSITSCSIPITRSCERWWPTANCVHVNNGYCSLLEPKSISGSQFSEWITGRNPGTYVAVHYIKLIDFTFGGRLKTVAMHGQRGIVGPAEGPLGIRCSCG